MNQNNNNQSDLSFSELRQANNDRAVHWLAGKPRMSLEFSVIELCGETGELANAIKKLLRFRAGIAGGVESMENVIEEMADVVICVDLLAESLGIDLGEAVTKKFNKTSEKHGFSTKLPDLYPERK